MKRILTASLIVILIVLSAIPLSAKEKVIDVIDQYVTGLKKSKDSEHKLYYINLLSPYKDARVVPVIIRILRSDRDRNVRMAAVELLGNMASNVCVAPLFEASTLDEDLEIRMTAKTYLEFIEKSFEKDSAVYGEAKEVYVKNPLRKISIPGGVIIGTSLLITGFLVTYLPFSYVNSQRSPTSDKKEGYFYPKIQNLPVILVVSIGAGALGTAFGLNIPMIFGKKDKKRVSFNIISRGIVLDRFVTGDRSKRNTVSETFFSFRKDYLF